MIWFSVQNVMIQKGRLPRSIRFVLLNFLGGRSVLRDLKIKKESDVSTDLGKKQNGLEKKVNTARKCCLLQTKNDVLTNLGTVLNSSKFIFCFYCLKLFESIN